MKKFLSPVSFEVIEISKANKEMFAVAKVKFYGKGKEYTYVRKYQINKHGLYYIVIDGCRVCFNNEFEHQYTERLYETKGTGKKTSTENSVVDKIKTEIEDKVIDVQPIIEEKVEDNKEVHHEMYDTIKQCLESNIPVYLAGPAGSGKNYTVEQIARELGWNFYFSNSVQQEYKLTGFIDAGGNFHDTEFYKACNDDNECVFFLDEMDASIPEVLVLLNAAIANGYFEFPTGRVNINNVHFVAAGNTVGSGADDMYTGRMVLDQATLDRFAIIEFDYSRKIELSLSNNNFELVNFVRSLRDIAKDNGIRATFSYRCITMVTKLEKTGMHLGMILKIAVFKGLDQDTINTFNNSKMDYNNKYGKIYRNDLAA